jgi:hypothetical protein
MGEWNGRSIGMFSPCWMKLVACIALIALLPIATGCYGTFPITHTIWKFNGEVTGLPLVHTLVFWAFVIIPVYWIGILADALVMNLIEFWTGEPAHASIQANPDGTLTALTPSADGKEATLTVSRDGQVLQEVRFVRTSAKETQVFDQSSRQVGAVLRTPSSGLVLMDARGMIVGTIGSGDISQFRAAVERLQSAPAPQPAAAW